VLLINNTRTNVLRGTWHYQRANGVFAPFPEATSARLQQVFAAPSCPNPVPTAPAHDTPLTKYGLPCEDIVDIGNNCRISRLDSGVIVQSRSGLAHVRIVLHGHPRPSNVVGAGGGGAGGGGTRRIVG